jgi:nucleoside-triphosphatase
MMVSGAVLVNKILLTGRPGVGKTTVVRRVLERMRGVAGGFLTEEIRRQGRRLGFLVTDIRTGQTGTLAHVKRKGGPRVGKYVVDVAEFERIGVAALREALKRPGSIVIDEMGKMELSCPAFAEAVLQVLDSGHPVLATVPVFRHPFIDALRRRDDLRLITVTAENRGGLPDEIVRFFSEGVGPETDEAV